MKTPQPHRLGLEHLLLLGVLTLFAVGAIWVGTTSHTGGGKPPANWASLLPKIGLPLLQGLLPR
ncbi:MAG: hypothetical protein IPL39_24000 [Opitutaceae bacterium]|nr:hypothetical protein [Opitutaceae bacterium]